MVLASLCPAPRGQFVQIIQLKMNPGRILFSRSLRLRTLKGFLQDSSKIPPGFFQDSEAVVDSPGFLMHLAFGDGSFGFFGLDPAASTEDFFRARGEGNL